jgi:hypothetical protein
MAMSASVAAALPHIFEPPEVKENTGLLASLSPPSAAVYESE